MRDEMLITSVDWIVIIQKSDCGNSNYSVELFFFIQSSGCFNKIWSDRDLEQEYKNNTGTLWLMDLHISPTNNE